MSKSTIQNKYALMLGSRTVSLRDGTLCFSKSKTAAMRDMRQFVREWRCERGQTAAVCSVGFELKSNRGKQSHGLLRIVELDTAKPMGWENF